MTSAAAFIEALQRRLRLSAHRMPPPGEYPPGWQAWFAAMAGRVGAVTGASVADVIGVFLARPLSAPPRRAALMTRWQAFSTLWRQQWHPAEPEDRRLHWVAATVSILVNLFFAIALVWLMYLRFLGLAPPPQGEDVVQVEFIGKGTPEAEGGGSEPVPGEVAASGQPSASPAPVEQASPPEPQDESAPSDEPLRAPEFAARPDTAAPVLKSAPAIVRPRDIPEPQPPTVPVEQAVAVSEPAPDQTQVFILPPTRKQPVAREPVPRELKVKVPEIKEVEVAAPVQPAQASVREPALTAPELRSRTPSVVERAVAEPLRAPTTRELVTRPVSAPELRSTEPQVRPRDVPTPRPAAAAAAPVAATPNASARSTAPAAAAPSTTATATPAAKPGSASAPKTASTAPKATAPAPGSTRPATAPGTGPRAAPAPGTTRTSSRADDWGASTRNQPGAQRGEPAGVFNADGSVKLTDGPGSAAPGLPPGTVTEEIANLDRAGTWRKRRPNDYEPTSLDRYWVPNETLLAEWVRRGVRSVAIPIPGTGKRIVCKVSVLALGGACGISDPNLNEQPAEARPPPDIPFKPHLQENNGSAPRPPGG